MVKAKDISITLAVPKLDQLSMKRVWPRFKNDSAVTQYMPLTHSERIPPRRYFYEILHSKFRSKFNNLVEEAKQERLEEMEHNNLVITASSQVLEELKSCSVWNDISQSQISKRVTPNRIQQYEVHWIN